MKSLSPEDTARLTLAVAERFKDKSMRPLLWVRDLHRAAEVLASGGENCDTATTFWLRLFASLDELIHTTAGFSSCSTGSSRLSSSPATLG